MTQRMHARRLLLAAYGDSLCMPRYKDGIQYHSTYLELVREAIEASGAFHQVHLYNRAIGGASISELDSQLARDVRYFGRVTPSVAILHAGVVDCAPRPLSPRVRARLSAMPKFLRDPVVALLHNNRSRILGAGYSYRQTAPPCFHAIFTRMIETALRHFDRVIVVNIAPPTPALSRHSPGFDTSVELYNGLISSVLSDCAHPGCTLVDLHKSVVNAPEGLAKMINQEDGHHLTADGHALCARLVLKEVADFQDGEQLP